MRSEESPRVAPARSTPALTRLIDRLGATGRLAAALAIAVAAYVLCPDVASWHTRVVFGWDAATIAYLCLAWTIIGFSDAESTRAHALGQDTSGFIIFLFVLGAACASVVAIAFVVGTIRELPFWTKAWRLSLTVAALTTSWIAIQTVFAFHYARRYYSDEKHMPTQQSGLRFPGDADPDYMDFAYYSFVIGMTSQVSDVQVLSSRMRLLTLVHGVLAFIFNIAVLALSINIIASAV
jgi:uncharacterized membrane protein